ncbi:MAG: hypothetical protein K6T80_05785 [Firmicutes bacterium]|nr:hypothetical protein [Bacillota bacterium]
MRKGGCPGLLELLGFFTILLISIHTASYGLWAWRRKMRRGAAGVFIIALLNLAVPVLVWLYHRLY